MSIAPSCLACLKLEAAISNSTWHYKPLQRYVVQTPFLQRPRNCKAHKTVVKTDAEKLKDSVQFATIG